MLGEDVAGSAPSPLRRSLGGGGARGGFHVPPTPSFRLARVPFKQYEDRPWSQMAGMTENTPRPVPDRTTLNCVGRHLSMT